MRKVILYIAVSLDGYIADAWGGVDWLGGQSADYAGDYGYEAFTAQVDTVIMGGRTYRQITQELFAAAVGFYQGNAKLCDNPLSPDGY